MKELLATSATPLYRVADDGRTVVKRAIMRRDRHGSALTIGFPVCTVSQYVADDAAHLIAQALNREAIRSGEWRPPYEVDPSASARAAEPPAAK